MKYTTDISIIRLSAKYSLCNEDDPGCLTLDAYADSQEMIGRMVASLDDSLIQLRLRNGRWVFNEHVGYYPFSEYEDLLSELEKEVLHAFSGDSCHIADREFISRFNVKNTHANLKLNSLIDWERGKSKITDQFKDISHHKYFSWGGTVPSFSTKIADTFLFWTP